MHWSSIAALLPLAGAGASPTPRASSGYEVTDNVVQLERGNVKAKSSKALLAAFDASVPLKSVEEGSGFVIPATLGSNGVFPLIFDTGSSDLWTPTSNFKCLNPKGKTVAQSKCDFKKTFSGTYSGGAIKDENFNITYGDEEYAIGTVGYEPVTVGGIEVAKQEISLVDETYFHGAGVAGIMGFAYDAITSAYHGTNPATDTFKDQAEYKNWITNAIAEKKFDPLFSLVIERGSPPTASVAFGGLPNITFNHDFASTPLVKRNLGKDPVEKTQYSYYTIIPSGLTLDGQKEATSTPFIVDSGTTLLYLPLKLAEAVNAAYDPPSELDKSAGIFINKCDAKPPAFGVDIGGKTFTVNTADLLVPSGEKGVCVAGVQAGPTNFAILGDTFLKNVVAVYDIGASEMKFAAHENY